jgi:hypothetical protein
LLKLKAMSRILCAVFLSLIFVCSGSSAEDAYAPAAISDTPAVITLDFSKEKGVFSRELFSVMDAPFVDRDAYGLLKEIRATLVANMDRDITPVKAKAIADYGFEALVFFDQRTPLAQADLERKIQAFLDKIDTLKEKYPGFDVKYLIFANEPDLPPPPGGFTEGIAPAFWSGSMDELFENYAIFANYIKSKKPQVMVGGLGFADAGSRVWIQGFLEYVEKNKVPLDFLPYHCYASAVKPYIEGLNSIEEILNVHPGLNPQLAVTELDIRALMVPNDQPYPEMDTAWKAAHNILAMLYLADRGVWMLIDYGGPSRDSDQKANFLWVKSDGSKKPVYYAHQAFNDLVDTIQIAQEGSNFETFGVGAGKSSDNNSLTIVIAGYDQYSLLPYLTKPQPLHGVSPHNYPPEAIHLPERERQSREVPVYKSYTLKIKNLPWKEGDALEVKRFAVDDTRALTLMETEELKGASEITLSKDISLPQVQLIKVTKKE